MSLCDYKYFVPLRGIRKSNLCIMATVDHTPQTILVAEDSSDDAFFVRRAVKELCGKELTVVPDGEACIRYLSLCSKNAGGQPLPDLIILDIKMPRADGHEVLAWLRQ